MLYLLFHKTNHLKENDWNKVKKSNKIGQEYKTLISIFAYTLTAVAGDIFLEGGPGNRLYFHAVLTFSQYFLIFEDSKS